MSNENARLLLKAWLPVVLWMGVIFLASTDLGTAAHTSLIIEPVVRWFKPDATPEQFEFVHFLVRKAAHLTEYAVFGILLLRAVRMTLSPRFARTWWRAAALAWVISALYASSDEYHQTFVAGRTPCVQDVLIDSTGAALGLALAGIATLTKRPPHGGNLPGGPAREAGAA